MAAGQALAPGWGRDYGGNANVPSQRFHPPSFFRHLLAMAVLVLAAPAFADGPDPKTHTPDYAPDTQGYVEGAQVLEGRILAPCCWNQTLDIHGSEPANALRREIRRRLRQGESVESIENDIVARYGERIRAVPPGSPLKSLAVWLSIGMVLAGVGAAFMLVRWRRRFRASVAKDLARDAKADADSAPKPKKRGGRDHYDEVIDAELDRL